MAASLAGCAGAPSAGEAAPEGPLPRAVRPLHYALDLEIDPERSSYAGEVAIEIENDAPVRTIWLHGEDFDVASVSVEREGEAPRAGRWTPTAPRGVTAVHLTRALPPGRSALRIRYRGDFADDLVGLYRFEAGGEFYAVTQFDPIDARRAFPGFDEPRFKTPFDISLTVPAGAVAISNAPAESEISLPDGRQRIRFATTRPLPTYLIAVIVGPWDVVKGAMPSAGPRDRAVPFRGLAVRGRGSELAYALAKTPALLEALERYFDEPYPYEKLDVIAIPDFSAGAMENVGAMTFRDSLLLLDAETAPQWQLRAFAEVMAHELAHNWFGNAVTKAWWDDLWLNEAFATWISHRAVEQTHPEYHFDVVLLETSLGAMEADSLTSARQIRQPIESSHDILNAFDAITYSKGAGVIAMFERWLGAETFRAGIQRYMERHRWGATTTEDLTAALSEAAERDVATPFMSFLTQPGVPYLETERVCDTKGSRLRVAQSRYRRPGAPRQEQALWQVPACVRYGVDGETRERCGLVAEREGAVPLEADACPDWVMPNAEGAGYYRWRQSDADGQRLLKEGWSALSDLERIALASNVNAAFAAGAIGPEAAFSAARRFASDPQRAVAEQPLVLLTYVIDFLLGKEQARPQARGFAASLYGPRADSLGFEAADQDDGDTRLLRAAILGHLALVARDAEVRRELERRGRAYAGLDGPADRSALDSDLAFYGLAVAVQTGGAEVFDALRAQLGETRDSVERARILRALATSLDPELAAQARALALDPALRVNEVMVIPATQMQRPELRAGTWQWIRDEYDALAERLGRYYMGELPTITGYFCDEARAAQVEAFFAPLVDGLEGGPRNLAGALEEIRLCAALAQLQGPALAAYFAERGE
jgi:alanyl aminopeptidase